MLKYLSVIILTIVAHTAFAANEKPQNFTMSELEHIEYTATLSYVPEQDDPAKGYRKGVPVKLIHQKFMIDYKDDNRNITKIEIGKKALGSLLITYEDPEQLGISSLDDRFKSMLVIMKDEKNTKIDNYTDFRLKLKIYAIQQRLNTHYTASLVELYDNPDDYKVVVDNLVLSNAKGKRYDLKQTVVLAPNVSKFKTDQSNIMRGLIVELEAKTVDNFHSK
jgi:hypothetical protein